MVRQQLGSVRIDAGWLIRPAPHTSFLRHIVQAGSIGHIAILLGAHAAQFGLFLLSWWVIGSATLGGRLSRAVLGAWALLMLALIPIRLIEAWAQGRLAIGVGGLLKQRLLHGAFQIEPERVRSRGAGQLLGAVMESEAVANLALGGALTGVTVVVELFIAAFVLAVGPGGGLRVALYALWLLLTAFWAARYLRSRSRWTVARVAMTNDLIERMVGHRTRLAQEVPEHWHDGEDEALQGYYATSHQVDRRALVMQAFVGRGWTVVGLLGATPLILGHASPGVTAAALGGIILASTALAKTMAGINQIADALIAWRQIAPLYAAAGNRAASGSTSLAMPPATNAAHPADHPLLEAFDLAFRYRPAGKPIVDNCRLQINGRDRVLLEGPSGGGKSTLAALLVGLKSPESGLLLLKGLDRQSWGADAWRRQVVVAPQFHENHVLTGTFAFNLLMGVAWPATPADMARAAEICRELGLDEVLARMPAGLHQMLGESGWQLSHGERSRLYIARALLQNPDLIILDESFAALDPHTLHRCLQAVDRRAKALLVIAHP
jgi:ATP-binding cassette subfamily B protein